MDPRRYQVDQATGRTMDIVAGLPVHNDYLHDPQPGNLGAPKYPAAMQSMQPSSYAQHQPHYGVMGRGSPPCAYNHAPASGFSASCMYSNGPRPQPRLELASDSRLTQESYHFGSVPLPYQPAPYQQQNVRFDHVHYTQAQQQIGYDPNPALSMGMGQRELSRPNIQQPSSQPSAFVLALKTGHRPGLIGAPSAYGPAFDPERHSY